MRLKARLFRFYPAFLRASIALHVQAVVGTMEVVVRRSFARSLQFRGIYTY